MNKYYLAYGSNLNLSQMKRRCPNAKKVGTFLLKGYQLEFRYYLTIKKNKNSEVPLGIFQISEEDEKSLDRYEGYPTFYRKEYLDIKLDDKDIKGLVYIMNEEVRDILRPSQTYFNTCLQGYKDFGFDDIYLYDAYNLIK